MANNAKHKISEFLVTGFFTGYFPFIPGTFGALIGVVIYIFTSNIPWLYYSLVPLLLIGSVALSDYALKHIFKDKYSPHIVVDEIVGYLVTMISFPFDGSLESYKYMIMGFLLFRLFDIWKPYPIKKTLNMDGGMGIVLGDVLAAIYANLFLQFLRINPQFFPFI